VNDPNCIFCKIVKGEIPCYKVYENERVIAFMDLYPAADGHTLVVPKAHFANLFEAEEASLAAASVATRHVARALRAALQPDGLTLMQLNGEAAGQTVFHYHVHLIPRAAGEALKLHGARQGKGERLAEVAKAIAAHLGA